MPSTAEPRPRTRLPSAGRLLLGTLLVVAPAGSLAVCIKVREQRALIVEIRSHRGSGVGIEREFGGRTLRRRFSPDWMSGLDSIGSIGWREATDSSVQRLRICGDLRELDLMSSAITDEGLRHLSGMTNLESLKLDATEVTADGLRHLRDFNRLRLLSMSATGVTDQGLAALANFPNLQALDLRSTDVGDAGLAEIGKVQSLQWLSLGRTAVTDDGLLKLSGMASLKSLHLDSTAVSDDAVRAFQAANPGCYIHR